MINVRLLKIASIITLLIFTWFLTAADFTYADQKQKKSEPRTDIIYKEGKKKKSKTLLYIGGAVLLGVLLVLLLSGGDDDGDGENGAPDPTKFDTEVLKFQWVSVPAGEFTMGDSSGEGEVDESPEHPVFLSQYEISKYEVTFEQYDYFCDDTGRSKPENLVVGRGKQPVINVSWDDADEFCKWLSRKTTGKTFSLPTEAQWEKAARGTDRFKYPWGNEAPTCDRANYDYCVGKVTVEVGSYPTGQSPYGLYDMAGNVWEWCSDWYGKYYYGQSEYNDPQGPATGTSHVIRGGCYSSDENNIRTVERDYHTPGYSSQYVGFRICRSNG